MLNNTAFALGLCIFLLIISAVFLIKHRYKRLVIILYLVALLAISTLFVNQKIDRLHNLCGNSIECTFTVIEDSERLGTSSSVSVKSNGGAIPRGSKIMLYCYTGEEYLAGDTLNAVVTLSGLADDKLRDYCYGNQIYVKGTARAVEKTSRISYFYYSLGVIRRFVKECLFNNLSYDAAALNIALTIGDKSYLSAEFNDAASKTGVSHIMVVSGLHVAIIMGFIMGSVQKLLRNSWIKAAIGISSVVLISAICGFTLSVIRSAYMFILSAIAPIFKRDSDSLNSLGVAVIIILLFTPTAYLSVSMRLSVLATLAVVWLSPFYTDLLLRGLRASGVAVSFVVGTMMTSSLATLMTAPVCIEVFGWISFVAPVTNLLIVYPVTWALTSSILGVSGAALRLIFVSKPPLILSEFCSRYIYAAIDYVEGFPIIAVEANKIGLYVSYILIFAVIAFMHFYKYFSRRRIFYADYKRGRAKTRNNLKKFGERILNIR
ncbi:MAG: ComEC/Rec2 family competence protein [Clostridia bacterium]|nr:ComEC/Rec2 family competence protein [Clostridia bacterium]